MRKKKYFGKKESSTLLDYFKVGDKVKQVYYDPNGTKREYAGIIWEINKHCIAVQWDTVDGKPASDKYGTYPVYHMYEVLYGDKNS